jgi:hypothetical protein
MLGIRIPYLVCILAWSCAVSLACWGYFVDEQGTHTLLEVVAHLPCYRATPGGSTLLTCGFDPHTQQVGRCAVWIVKKLRRLAHRTLSRAWIPNGHFGFPLWYKHQGAKPLTLLF